MEKQSDSFAPSEALNQALATIAARSQRIVSEFLDRQSRDQNIAGFIDPLQIGDAFLQMTAQMLASPVTLVEAQISMWGDYMRLWQHTAQRLMGGPAEESREESALWRQKDIFDFIKQSYLMTARWIQALVRSVDGLDETTARQIDFYTRQFIDARDPASLFENNPDLLRATIDSQGENLVKGLDHLLGELERGKARLAGAARVAKSGEPEMASKHSVALRNEVIELLHYASTADRDYRTPMLMIPPWTHKPGLFDLRPSNSLVKWALEQGHQVFVLSWREGDAKRDLAEILKKGPLAALDEIGKITGSAKVNGVGFGLGGTLLAVTQGLLAARGEDRFASASYIASLLDFTDAGEISVFIAEEQLQRIDQPPAREHVADLLRANDLIWSFVIDCFLGERAPFPFDLLNWNEDSLIAPAALQRFYLRDLYQQNLLAQPDGVIISRSAIDLGLITAPAYVVGMTEDHLAPWKSVFAGTGLLGGPVRFLQAGGGHLGGAINPPALRRHFYWTPGRGGKDWASWLKNAHHHPGSWWEDWRDWLAKQSGPQIVS